MNPLRLHLPTGIRPWQLVVMTALGLVLFDNRASWAALHHLVPWWGYGTLAFYASFAGLLAGLFSLLLATLTFRPVLKPALCLLVLVSAGAAYFMDTYGVAIDTTMVQNVMETNPGEIGDLLNLSLLARLLLLGVLPAIVIARVPVHYPGFWRGWGERLALAAGALVVVGLSVAPFYARYAPLFRQEDQLTHFINPTNVVYATTKYALRSHHATGHDAITPVGLDSHPGGHLLARPKPSLVILVVGETARADHFSLNGYARQTNPELAQLDVLNFSDVHACGTSTAVSVPCMFSRFGRDDYSDSKGKSHENVLDMLQRAGIRVFWRDNNSDCKGTCLRIPNDEIRRTRQSPFCNGSRCLDEVMLEDLQAFVDEKTGNTLVVLHSDGSHGPEYFDRYPAAFERFSPVCHTNQLGECTRDEVVNVYDNTILYTDHFLAESIHFLQRNSARFDTALLYVSDHGESLGENGLYLHAAPYAMAPEAQTHVPMVGWLSGGAWSHWGINQACARTHQEMPLTHDNLFHSLLGLFDVQSTEYKPELDLFAPCRTPAS